jgi:hypothetical protein
MLLCQVSGNRLEVRSSDYREDDLDKLAPEILKAIRNKKKLLKLGTIYQFPNFSLFNRRRKIGN